jgi:ubiquinone/menaquinone biosynthesis C-methylase UbiE
MIEESFYDHADLYDLVMADVAPEGQAGFYLRQAQACGGPVLELACGTGRLTLPIAAAGLDTTGLDASAAMLAGAERKVREGGLHIGFIHGDMRSFEIGRRFRMIFVGARSLQHLTDVADLIACFSTVNRHLESDGIFVFDIFNPDMRILARDKLQRFPVGEYQHGKRGRLTLEEATDYDSASQVSRTMWYFAAPDQRDSLVVQLVLRSIFPQELPLLINAGGLRLEQRFGDFSGGPFDGGSRHQVCVCRRAA